MSYLLDTNVLSEITKPRSNPSVVEWLENTDELSQFLSVLTIGEFQKGIANLPSSRRRKEGQVWFDHIVERYNERILPFTLPIAMKWGTLEAKLRQIGRPSSLIDTMIAATALVHDLTVVTRNVKDFETSNVRVLNIWE